MFGETDQDILDVHLFMCIVSKPVLMAPIDAQDSAREITRVVKDGAAIMAKFDGHLIGVLCIVPMSWWYNTKKFFMGDRGFFVLPQFHHLGVGARLVAEAQALAEIAGMPLILTPPHVKRRSSGVLFLRPKVLLPKGN